MIGSLLYLQYHSALNRITSRLKRLKQPKYLVGAAVGLLWFYLYFFRWIFVRGSMRDAGTAAMRLPGDLELYELLAALALLTFFVFAWIFPSKRAGLSFTEAETAFLFPAPINRRGLIHFKLLKSQGRILFSVLFLALVSNRFGSGGRMLIHALGWWIVLVAISLHALGASFARTMLFDRGISNWQRRFGVLGILAVGIAVVGAWAVRSLPSVPTQGFTDLKALVQFGHDILVSGPLPYLLYPFRIVVRPYFVSGTWNLLLALWPALLMLAALYGWVILSDVAFEEESLAVSRKDAERRSAFRARRMGQIVASGKASRSPFTLSPHGPPAVALLWKNLISAGQSFTLRRWIVMAAIFFLIALGSRSAGRTTQAFGGMLAAMFSAWAILLGPQIIRHDFRQDLAVADILKTYPLRGWQVALGELLAPAAILSGVQWLLLILFAWLGSHLPGMSEGLAVAIALGAGMVLPVLNFITLLIPNAAVLLFPAWFQPGKDAPQGIEMTGQRLIFALGQMLVLVVALILPAAVFAGVFFAIKFTTGMVVIAVPVASAAAAVVLGIEGFLGIGWLGRLFERLDISAEG